MFLQLLVAQLQNQNPTSPMDPSQFVGQLAQFSELSQVTSIYQLLQQNLPASGSGSGSTGGTPAAGSNSAKGGSPAVAAASSIVPTAAAAAPVAGSSFLAPTLSDIATKIQGVF
jgi:flagellar basal-body rod modification protein FlgD